MRHDNDYDGYGCNQFTGCVPECKYYAKEGKLDDEEFKADMKIREEEEEKIFEQLLLKI